ncbi:RidA family protein [Roseibium alexandrii]|uniref:Putative translation initiation inhibitor, yjgF family n=1 Tax=Roseibium alexandrii (strain DSM 17067 / NCIMB 14079 / DFL-11) TaxID=244592 RepID=A0A5E8H2G6_ROSAD|nr:RidA family protein [Roseibium alexandrii]EEE46254.1 putative translation initiation inhibitor, yjgF family [Roseibium alexandrii DFL-11]
MLPIRQNIEQLGPVAGPYSHAVIHGDTLYTSGLTAFGSNSQSEGAAAQTHSILDQLSVLAESCNTSLQHLLKVTIFAVDPADIPEIREVLTDRYGENVPASSLVFVKELFSPDLRLEIEAVFAVQPT